MRLRFRKLLSRWLERPLAGSSVITTSAGWQPRQPPEPRRRILPRLWHLLRLSYLQLCRLLPLLQQLAG